MGGPKLRNDIILQMIKPYVRNKSITYDDFDKLFNFLSINEQYEVENILCLNGIKLMDANVEIADTNLNIRNEDYSNEEFESLYEDLFFKDTGFSKDDDILTISKDIKQSNEVLCGLIQQGNKQAAQDLCIKNKRLVDKYVVLYIKKYGNRLDFEDLEQVGYMGLMKAAKKFDISQGNAFSTYAVFWIKQAISREIMDNGYAIRIPVHMMEKINKVIAIDSFFESKGFCLIERIRLISNELNLTQDEVKQCIVLKNNFVKYASLNSLVGEGEMELGELLPAEETVQTEEIVFKIILREQLKEVLGILTKREQKILILRFGLADNKERTLEEVGRQFNVTRERIRQIEEKALRKLRVSFHSKKLKDYLY